jgi:hypothetical protein
MYKHKLSNLEDKRLFMIASNSIENHMRLKWVWYKDTKSWLDQWGIEEEVTLLSIDTIKTTIISKFKETLWNDKELEDKRKLRYYKEMINPNLKNQKYLYVLTCIRKKQKRLVLL